MVSSCPGREAVSAPSAGSPEEATLKENGALLGVRRLSVFDRKQLDLRKSLPHLSN